MIRGCVLALCVAAGAMAYADEIPPQLAGVWSSRTDLGAGAKGELLLSRDGAGLRARIEGREARATNGVFDFGDDAGRFRGDARGGWWIQPAGLPGMAYATPVSLTKSGGMWRGAVAPLPQTFTLFLKLSQGKSGAWRAAFRNPEFNMNAGASQFAVRRDGARLMVQRASGETVREIDASQAPQRLTIAWPPLPAPLTLTPDADPSKAWLARAPGAYAYARPPETGDGWNTARARTADFDEAALAAFVQQIIDADPAAARPSLIHSVLVVRRGRLVLEEYFHGYDRDTPHDLRSAGKTFASLLLGAAMHDGAKISPESRLYETVGAAPPDTDPRRAEITLAHLLTHSSGLACDDNDDESPGNEGAMQGQTAQPDWWAFTLALPMAHAPGERYAYCTAGVNLVGAALRKVTGESAYAQFDRAIARPLQFGRYHWNLMPTGEGYLGGGVYMRPRDLAKIGQLALDGGVWNGRRVLDRAFLARATAAQIEINEQTTGMSAERFAAVATRGADGLGWHRYGVRAGDRRLESYEASGNGGQLLIVVPEVDLVVVLTGGNYGQGGIWTRWRDDLVGGKILAALRR